MPEVCLTIAPPGFDTANLLLLSNPENCTVAPRRESMKEPTKPARNPSGTSGHWGGMLASGTRSIRPSTQYVTPISPPPSALARVPIALTPPLVPGGTFRNVVMRRGTVLESIPTSDAHSRIERQLRGHGPEVPCIGSSQERANATVRTDLYGVAMTSVMLARCCVKLSFASRTKTSEAG
eukprot:scaffold42125_cov31-Tisochrysis_lutea.AAC.1